MERWLASESISRRFMSRCPNLYVEVYLANLEAIVA